MKGIKAINIMKKRYCERGWLLIANTATNKRLATITKNDCEAIKCFLYANNLFTQVYAIGRAITNT